MQAREAENIKKNPRQQVQGVLMLLWGILLGEPLPADSAQVLAAATLSKPQPTA